MKTLHSTSLVIAAALSLPFAQATELKPSRLIAVEQVGEQVGSLSTKLIINQRQLDPFGQTQDLKQAPEVPIQCGWGPKPKAVAFADVVGTIDVVAVSPNKGRIMSGGRPYTTGQRIKLPYKGVSYEIELVAVSAGQITYKNVKTGEQATAKFKGAIETPLQRDDW